MVGAFLVATNDGAKLDLLFRCLWMLIRCKWISVYWCSRNWWLMSLCCLFPDKWRQMRLLNEMNGISADIPYSRMTKYHLIGLNSKRGFALKLSTITSVDEIYHFMLVGWNTRKIYSEIFTFLRTFCEMFNNYPFFLHSDIEEEFDSLFSRSFRRFHQFTQLFSWIFQCSARQYDKFHGK